MEAAALNIARTRISGVLMNDITDDMNRRRSLPDVPSEVLDRCRRGDIAAFEDVYRRYKSVLFSMALRFHGNRFDAEDSLQDAFLSMYRSIGHFRGEAHFGTWMYRVMLNACIDKKRSRRRLEDHADYTAEHIQLIGSGSVSDDVLLREALHREIAGLPALHKAVFLLYTTEGLSHPEIAETLKIRVGTSKSYYHRAKEELKKRLLRLGIGRKELDT